VFKEALYKPSRIFNRYQGHTTGEGTRPEHKADCFLPCNTEVNWEESYTSTVLTASRHEQKNYHFNALIFRCVHKVAKSDYELCQVFLIRNLRMISILNSFLLYSVQRIYLSFCARIPVCNPIFKNRTYQ